MTDEEQPQQVTLIVDGANVMGSRAGGWWHDPPAAMARLHDELKSLAAEGIPGPVPGEGSALALGNGAGPAVADDGTFVRGDGARGTAGAARGGDPVPGRWHPHIVLVVEGKARKVTDLVTADRAVRVVLASGAGDDEIARLAGSLPGRRIVVTADAELRHRCRGAGAEVAGPRWLTRLLA